MPTITIQQFRAALATRAGASAAVRAYREIARRPALAATMRARAGAAYRELARRPQLAAAMRTSDWVTWPPAARPRANA